MRYGFVRWPLRAAACLAAASLLVSAAEVPKHRNVIVFVADGLRAASVNPADAPALFRLRSDGVNFVNSHSIFPTVTMTNASAIATGHYPGDTGQFANNLFVGRRIFATGNFGRMPGTLTPNVEEDQVLGDIDDMFGGNYVRETSLLALARANGYNTAALGKIGPTAMQDVSQLAPMNGRFATPATIILDGATGSTAGLPVDSEVARLIADAHLPAAPPARNQAIGTNTTPGTLSTNAEHYRWFADVATRVLMPKFVRSGRPFMLVFWSGDPDQTQHAQGDSLNKLTPGINGPTSRAAVRNADNLFEQLLAFVNADPSLRATTDVFVTADHGFSTISHHEIDASHVTKSYSAGFLYKDGMGRQEVNTGFLPPGALPIDLAHALDLPLFASDVVIEDKTGGDRFVRIDPAAPQQSATVRQHPLGGALLGGTGRVAAPLDAKIILVGSSVYVPDHDRALVRATVAALATFDYIGALFVHDSYGAVPGALPLSMLGHVGETKLPAPAIVVAPREFALDAANPLLTSVIVDPGPLQHGQGNHGALARSNTFNNMAAIGPDFKKGFVDEAPVSNADIAPTLAKVMGLSLPARGKARGRVLSEALAGGPSRIATQRQVRRSAAAASGRATMLRYQQVGGIRYLDEACFEANGCGAIAASTTTR